MTIQAFKDSITVGKQMVVTNYASKYSDGRRIEGIPENLKPVREVTQKDTTGFYLKEVGSTKSGRGSFCGWPKASELTAGTDGFTIEDRMSSRTYKFI